MDNPWEIFSNWSFKNEKHPQLTDWGIFGGFAEPLATAYLSRIQTLKVLTDEWNTKLKQFGGEPSTYNWMKFRPLRLAREEDWSDWLIYLFSESSSGYLAFDLFKIPGLPAKSLSHPIIAEREILTAGYRADIILQWQNRTFLHVEVKIGDDALDKTFETANALRKHFNATSDNWHDCILLLESQRSSWVSIAERQNHKITCITWDDAALSLRRSLIHSDETITWKVWAYSLLGAVEQRLIGMKTIHNKGDIELIQKKINILQRGLENGF